MASAPSPAISSRSRWRNSVGLSPTAWDPNRPVSPMAASARSDLSGRIRCIVADWGTSNFRAWAIAADGAVLDSLSDHRGLLSVEDGRFAKTFGDVCGPWLEGGERLPALFSGM